MRGNERRRSNGATTVVSGSAAFLSPSSIAQLHAVLHGALEQAVRWNLIPRNPAAAVKGPKVTKPDITPLTADRWGNPINGFHLSQRIFKPLLRRAELPMIRFHDLRHTAATLMLANGVNPKVVAEMLGHSSVTTTLNTYAHVLPTMQEDAARRVDAVLRGAG